MKRSTLLVGMGMLLAFSCTKETSEMETPAPVKTGAADEAPYEVYEPQGEAYLELEDGIMKHFSNEATAVSCDITKGIWLWESGINYWFPSVEFSEEDAFVSGYEYEVIDERNIQLNLINGAFENASLRSEFVSTYEDVSSRVGEGLEHAFTNVQFVDLQDDIITLRVQSVFYSNPVFATYANTPQVPSATMDKMAGFRGSCTYSPVRYGAWQDAARNVKAAFPKPAPVVRGLYYSNIVGFTSLLNSINRKYLDGTYLPGNPKALFSSHLPLLAPDTCLFIAQQNAYAQTMANQFSGIIGKRTYWDGIARLSCNPNVPPNGSSCHWSFNLDLAKHFTYPAHRQKLQPSLVL